MTTFGILIGLAIVIGCIVFYVRSYKFLKSNKSNIDKVDELRRSAAERREYIELEKQQAIIDEEARLERVKNYQLKCKERDLEIARIGILEYNRQQRVKMQEFNEEMKRYN